MPARSVFSSDDDDVRYPVEVVLCGIIVGVTVMAVICFISRRAHHREVNAAEEKRSATRRGTAVANVQASARETRETEAGGLIPATAWGGPGYLEEKEDRGVTEPRDDPMDRQVRIVFRELDANGDGEVEPHELLVGLCKLGIRSPRGGALSITHAHSMVVQADANGNGAVDEDEFLTIAASLRERTAAPEKFDPTALLHSWGDDTQDDRRSALHVARRPPPVPARRFVADDDDDTRELEGTPPPLTAAEAARRDALERAMLARLEREMTPRSRARASRVPVDLDEQEEDDRGRASRGGALNDEEEEDRGGLGGEGGGLGPEGELEFDLYICALSRSDRATSHPPPRQHLAAPVELTDRLTAAHRLASSSSASVDCGGLGAS